MYGEVRVGILAVSSPLHEAIAVPINLQTILAFFINKIRLRFFTVLSKEELKKEKNTPKLRG